MHAHFRYLFLIISILSAFPLPATPSSLLLPALDQYTSYDYDIGLERQEQVKKHEVQFRKLPNCHPKLWVQANKQDLGTVRLLPKEVTIRFARESIELWGPINAHVVLSSTKTGALYWNIIYYFGSWDSFLENAENVKTQETQSSAKNRLLCDPLRSLCLCVNSSKKTHTNW